jgi:hypothetical protein
MSTQRDQLLARSKCFAYLKLVNALGQWELVYVLCT